MINEKRGEDAGIAQHQIPVLQARQAFVKTAHPVIDPAVVDDRVQVHEIARRQRNRAERRAADLVQRHLCAGNFRIKIGAIGKGAAGGRHQAAQHQIQKQRVPDVVAVKVGDVLASGKAQALVAGACPVGFGKGHIADARIVKAAHHFGGLVVAGIIADQQFPILIALVKHALDRLADGIGAVVAGHDDADQRRAGQAGGRDALADCGFIGGDGGAGCSVNRKPAKPGSIDAVGGRLAGRGVGQLRLDLGWDVRLNLRLPQATQQGGRVVLRMQRQPCQIAGHGRVKPGRGTQTPLHQTLLW